MVLKLRNVPKVLPFLQNLMEKESIVLDELTSFTFNIKKEVCVVLESFLYFLRKFEKKKARNMFSFMLISKFKSLRILYSFIGREQGVAIVKEYDNNHYVSCC